MLMYIRSVVLVSRNFTIALVHLMALGMALGVIILPLAGCSDDGTGGPNISSLSTPTNSPQSAGAQSDTEAAEVAANGQDDPTISMTSAELLPDEVPEADSDAPVTDLEGEDPTISVTSTPTGATARLTWEASADPNVEGYFVHYGKQSSGEYASCSYEESQRVGAPPATITGLDPNTVYFFAISAFGESQSEAESPCSNEVTVVTPSVQS
jgi:hypothetical protein